MARYVNRYVNRYIMIVAILGLMPCGAVQARSVSSLPAGSYSTVIVVEGTPQPVTLELRDTTPGGRRNHLIYSRPRNCKMSIEYSGSLNNEHVFYVTGAIPSAGKWCRDLKKNGATVSVRAVDERTFRYDILSGRQIIESAEVVR
ncbi:hypothetical protein P7L75_04335 (plasmid) [Tistrella mobilis]|uniref:hypothetical protein n=1 Tax=Tistrella mobilis TaxID=171437 RepID=UPI0035560EDB